MMLLALGNLGRADPGVPQGVFKTHCDFSHTGPDDPLLFPGQPGASHLHVFFGNTGTAAYSTGQSLLAANTPLGAATTCRENGDGAAYWVPALYDQTSPGMYQEYDPRNIGAYYTDDRDPAQQQAVPFPTGFGQIAGKLPNVGKVRWGCGLNADRTSAPAQCPDPSKALTAIITFPACWDGAHLTAPDQSHVIQAQGSSPCPADHPVLMPRVQLHVFYNSGTGPHDWWLAPNPSEPTMYLPTSSMHADFFNGWDPATLKTRVSNCLNTRPSDPHLCTGDQP